MVQRESLAAKLECIGAGCFGRNFARANFAFAHTSLFIRVCAKNIRYDTGTG